MDERKTLISQFCPQYNTNVEFFIETSPESPSGDFIKDCIAFVT